MKTFYSIIKIATLPASGEVIAVGLLARHSDGFFLQFSDYKLQIAKLLMGKDEQMVDLVKEQISGKVKQLNEEIASQKPLKEESEILLKKSYFEYLHQYSNGLMQFSEPFDLSVCLNAEKFKQLFGVFVGETQKEFRVLEASKIDEKHVKQSKIIKVIKEIGNDNEIKENKRLFRNKEIENKSLEGH